MEIYLVRHTRVATGTDICYGKSDVQLAKSQADDLKEVKRKLKGYVFDKIYASPLQRCQILASVINQKFTTCEALTEMDFGDWEMQPWASLNKGKVDIWMQDFLNQSPPNGENFTDFSMKSIRFFDELRRHAQANERLLCVTHSGPIRAIICEVLHMSLQHAFSFDIDYGSVSCIDITSDWVKVKYLNY